MNPVSVEGTTEQFVNFTVRTDPVDAKVYLNDKLIGRTPIARSDIDPGNYKLRLEKTGYSGYSDQITVNSNQPVKINHKFAPLTGSVSPFTIAISGPRAVKGNETAAFSLLKKLFAPERLIKYCFIFSLNKKGILLMDSVPPAR